LEFNFASCVSSNFLIFVANELLGAKTEESRSNKILNYMYNMINHYICTVLRYST